MEIRTIIEKQQQHFSLGSFLTIPHFLDIFKNVVFRPNPLLPLIFWSKQTFSLTEKCTINIKFLTSPFCSLLTLSTLLLQISEQHQIVTKTNKDVSLKCFSHTALKYSTSCSNYCCLNPGGWREDSLLFTSMAFYKQRTPSLYLHFLYCWNAWRENLVGPEKEDIHKLCRFQHTDRAVEQSWNRALFMDLLFQVIYLEVSLEPFTDKLMVKPGLTHRRLETTSPPPACVCEHTHTHPTRIINFSAIPVKSIFLL